MFGSAIIHQGRGGGRGRGRGGGRGRGHGGGLIRHPCKYDLNCKNPKCMRIHSTANTQSPALTAPTDGKERLAEEGMPRELPAIIAGLDSKALMEVIVLATNELRQKDTSNKCKNLRIVLELKFDDEDTVVVDEDTAVAEEASSDVGDTTGEEISGEA